MREFLRWLGQAVRGRYVRELEREVARLENEVREYRDALFAVRGIPLPDELRPAATGGGVIRPPRRTWSQIRSEYERKDAEKAANEAKSA